MTSRIFGLGFIDLFGSGRYFISQVLKLLAKQTSLGGLRDHCVVFEKLVCILVKKLRWARVAHTLAQGWGVLEGGLDLSSSHHRIL